MFLLTSTIVEVVEEDSPEVRPPPPLARSVLYESLGLLPSNRLVEEEDVSSDYPEEGDIIQDVVIEVESPVLKVNRVQNPRKKLRERAEARRADRN